MYTYERNRYTSADHLSIRATLQPLDSNFRPAAPSLRTLQPQFFCYGNYFIGSQ